jgi:hypothetical protein
MAKTVSYSRGTGTFSGNTKLLLYTAPSSGVTKVYPQEWYMILDYNNGSSVPSNQNQVQGGWIVQRGSSPEGGYKPLGFALSYSQGGSGGIMVPFRKNMISGEHTDGSYYGGHVYRPAGNTTRNSNSSSAYLNFNNYRGGGRDTPSNRCEYDTEFYMTPGDKLYYTGVNHYSTHFYEYTLITVNET